MSKLVYPNNGIYNYCENDIYKITSNLTSAMQNSVFDIPSDFTYVSYLRSLDNELNNYIKEINSIDSKLKQTNDNYELLEETLEDSTKKLVSMKINERDRMIV